MKLPPTPSRRRNETSDLVHPIRIALNRLPWVRVVRNNTGVLATAEGTRVRYGLGDGSSDLVGIVLVHAMVRSDVYLIPFNIGRAFALEVKWPGIKPRPDQIRWLESVRRFGGFACVVHSIDEAMQAVERCRHGESS